MEKKTSKNKRQCIFCECDIKRMYPERPKGKPESDMWLNGIVDKIHAGYGSDHDGNIYVIAICDSCLIKKKKVIEFVGTYF